MATAENTRAVSVCPAGQGTSVRLSDAPSHISKRSSQLRHLYS
jgi:hypothetical protein